MTFWLRIMLPACTVIATVLLLGYASSDSSTFTDLIIWIFEQQRLFHRELTQDLRHLNDEGSIQAAWTLITVSFLYGLLHAAGPGHGKAILTTYLLTHRERVVKGIRLAAISAGCQGCTAIVLVYGITWLAGLAPRDAATATLWSERASYALVVLVGGLLATRSLRSLFARMGHVRLAPEAETSRTGTLAQFSGHEIPSIEQAPHVHSENCGCGHIHSPSAEQINGTANFRTTLGLVLSIGLRPCTGAVLVLVFASVMELQGAGIAAVMAMSFGTAIAVTCLALLVVIARRWATSVAQWRNSPIEPVADAIALAGSAILILLGIALLQASFGTLHPLGLV